MTEQDNILEKVQQYRDLQVRFEALTDQIQMLMRAHQGVTAGMSAHDLQQYRELARQRDDLENDMRALQQQLFGDYDEA